MLAQIWQMQQKNRSYETRNPFSSGIKGGNHIKRKKKEGEEVKVKHRHIPDMQSFTLHHFILNLGTTPIFLYSFFPPTPLPLTLPKKSSSLVWEIDWLLTFLK